MRKGYVIVYAYCAVAVLVRVGTNLLPNSYSKNVMDVPHLLLCLLSMRDVAQPPPEEPTYMFDVFFRLLIAQLLKVLRNSHHREVESHRGAPLLSIFFTRFACSRQLSFNIALLPATEEIFNAKQSKNTTAAPLARNTAQTMQLNSIYAADHTTTNYYVFYFVRFEAEECISLPEKTNHIAFFEMGEGSCCF